MSKHYLISQASLQMAHRTQDSELVGRIDNHSQEVKVAIRQQAILGRTSDLPSGIPLPDNIPNIPPSQVQVYKFYERYGFDWRAR